MKRSNLLLSFWYLLFVDQLILFYRFLIAGTSKQNKLVEYDEESLILAHEKDIILKK